MAKRKRVAMMLPCPFCGEIPAIEPWHGGAKTKMRIQCEYGACTVSPGVAASTERQTIAAWNARVRTGYPAALDEIETLRRALASVTAERANDVANLTASVDVARQQRDEARTALAKVEKERDALSLEKKENFIDPSRWRGPHGEPREDDAHRWREATVDGETVLLRAHLGGYSVFDSKDEDVDLGSFAAPRTIDAACAAADAHIAGLSSKVGRVFTVCREGAEGWCAKGARFDTGSASCPYVARKIVEECGGRESDKYDFAGEHWATLFARGGTITEEAVRAWLAARKKHGTSPPARTC